MGALPVKEKKKKIPTNKKTGNTRSLSFELFRQGKTISEIAAERKLTVSTVEGHLAVYVESGELKINELVSSAKRETVESAIKMLGTKETKPIYEFCGGLVGYGEIRLVLAAHTATPHA
jgi:ATP-dependent DNA helicase RecQ